MCFLQKYISGTSKCELCLHLRKEAFYVAWFRKLNAINVASRIEAAHDEHLYITLIPIINGNKDQITATLGLIVHQIMRKTSYWIWTLRSILFKKSTYYLPHVKSYGYYNFKKQE